MRMQVILDSLFARPGSAPILGGKKEEFRDWTTGNIEKLGKPEIHCSPRDQSLSVFWTCCVETVNIVYLKISKISPVAYIFQRPFVGGAYIQGGLSAK